MGATGLEHHTDSPGKTHNLESGVGKSSGSVPGDRPAGVSAHTPTPPTTDTDKPPGAVKGGSVADDIRAVMALPLSDAEKAEAVRHLLRSE